MSERSTSPVRIRRLPAVLADTGLSKSSLYEKVADGSFPRPVKLGQKARSVGWLEHEVEGWLAARVAERNSNMEVA